jgi:hypothetical protein
MGDTHTSARNVNIDKDLLAILCCPDTKQDVSVAADALIRRLNERIAKGELKNKAGQVVGYLEPTKRFSIRFERIFRSC